MGDMKLGFSWVAVVVFLLPMLINIVYVILPPANAGAEAGHANRIIEMIEQATRILYLFALVLLVSQKPLDFRSIWFVLALIFLVLYYIVWIRYFAGGRDVALMRKSFLLVPMPLAVFPVLYFIFAAVWMNNYIAVGVMAVFGIAHNIVFYQTFQ